MAARPGGPPPRDAATVVLLRDGADGVEAWLLTRIRQLVFAGGMAVFPGGRVDAADADLPFVDDALDTAAARLGGLAADARAVLGAAVRELFEETGVLLSAPAADLRASRAEIEAGRLDFGSVLRSHGLRADPGRLRPWSRWVTPAGEVRRYDTRFLVCGLPEGVQPADVTSESSTAAWFGVDAALEQAQRGELGLLPPTLVTLASIAAHSSVAEVLAAAESRSLDPVHPVLRTDGDDVRVELPDGTLLPIPRSLLA
jgi:8-oxo-dGTP pyrophosphatase MutT (NUDIX family)